MKREMFACVLLAGLVFLLLSFIACDDDDDDNDDSSPADDDDNTDDDQTDDDEVSDDDALDDDDDSSPPIVPPAEELAPAPTDDIGVFVAVTGDDANPGTMARPLRTIAAGLLRATVENKVVFVGSGEYGEAVTLTVSLYGGYCADWTRDFVACPSGIVAPIDEEVVAVSIIEQASETHLEGFHISATGGEFFTGVRVRQNTAPVRLYHNVIRGHDVVATTADSRGVSGFYNDEVELFGNDIATGALLAMDYATSIAVDLSAETLIIRENTLFTGFSFSGWGASSYPLDLGASGDEPSLVINNLAVGAGAAMVIRGPSLIINNTFAGGSQTLTFYSGEHTLINNVIAPGGRSGGVTPIFFYSQNEPRFRFFHNDIHTRGGSCYLDFYHGKICTLDYLNECTWSNCLDAAGNIDSEPQFADELYHPTTTSPLIDAGLSPVQWVTHPDIYHDLDRQYRPFNNLWDIGAYELHAY
ncbi:MAG TPA: hypothetical protein PKW95_06095 [bacterium]|nr:hypothetical protein [bacterium]